MPKIAELGHTGLWVEDLDKMKDFYTRVLGLTVTDEDAEAGMVFLSSRPDIEHHEFAWRVSSLEDVVEFHEILKREGVPVQQEVTHGNAIGIYFFDPEGNRNE